MPTQQAGGKGRDRVYDAGRSTAGWRRGEPITTLTQLHVGDVLIQVSHRFEAENLLRVTGFRQMVDGERRIIAQAEGCDGFECLTVYSHTLESRQDPVWYVWDFALEPKFHHMEAWYRAVPEATNAASG